MRKIIHLVGVVMLFFVTVNISPADTTFVNPTYTLRATNPDRTAPNAYEFDIYLLHTNPEETVYQLAGQQYFIFFNPNIWSNHLPGDSLRFSIVSSDLATNFRPRNPSISPDTTYLRLATNPAPGAGNGPIISSVAPGTKICRVRLYTSGATFTGDTINIRWKNYDPLPVTKEFAYSGLNGTVNTDITTPDTHFIDSIPTGVNPVNTLGIIPAEFSLNQNYPNPFNPATKIEYALPVEGKVNIVVYDLTGREMANLVNEVKSAGSYSVLFNGSNFASGIYFYRINVIGTDSRRFQETRRMVLIK